MGRFEALKAEPGGSLEFWGNDEPKCPHCGKSIDVSDNDLWSIYQEGEHEVTCPHCDDDFTVATNVSYSFSTETQDDDEATPNDR